MKKKKRKKGHPISQGKKKNDTQFYFLTFILFKIEKKEEKKEEKKDTNFYL